jgi:hypothetical protein
MLETMTNSHRESAYGSQLYALDAVGHGERLVATCQTLYDGRGYGGA